MAITIRKMKQPSEGKFLKKGKTFFRVKRNGATVQDFKKKTSAKRFAVKLRKK